VLRIFPAFLGLGLAVLWVVGLSVDATVWLTWLDGIAATLSFATVGVIPERRGSLWAAFCLGGLAGGLLLLWVVGLARHATPWLAWWTFVAGCLAALIACGAALQGSIDALRTRDYI
jgi:hypothetical protein